MIMTPFFDRSAYSLLTNTGQRKYLNQDERERFYECTKSLCLERRLFCRIIYYTGARIGEVMALHVPQVDFIDKTIIVQTFKQRRKNVYRQVPLPDDVLGDMLVFLDMRRKFRGHFDLGNAPLWSFKIRTGSNIIKRVMTAASITGARSCARGLRHGFAVHASTCVPITKVQKWLGHTSLKTTDIYTDITGKEDREMMKKVWE